MKFRGEVQDTPRMREKPNQLQLKQNCEKFPGNLFSVSEGVPQLPSIQGGKVRSREKEVLEEVKDKEKHHMETTIKIVGDYYEMELDKAEEEPKEAKNAKGKVTQMEAQVN